MSETKIQIYDENSLAECRICLENGETALITPCNCRGSQKYVHLECLNKWRVENINNEKYTNCEICKRKYNIRRFFKSEIFLYDDKPRIKFKSLIYFFILYFLAGVIWTMDFETNFKTIDIITFGSQNHTLDFVIYDIQNVQLGGIATFYYVAFAAYFCSMIHVLIHFNLALCVINRKKTYFKKMTPYLLLYILGCSNIHISYLLYTILNSRTIFVAALLIFTINNYLNIYYFMNKHNLIIKKMNSDINSQIVLSLDERERVQNNEIICNFDEIKPNEL